MSIRPVEEPKPLAIRLFGHPMSPVLGLGIAAFLWLTEGAPLAAAFLVILFYLAFTLPRVQRRYRYKSWAVGVYVIFFVGPLMYLLRLAFSADRLDLAAVVIIAPLCVRYCFVTMITMFARRTSILSRQGAILLAVVWLLVAATTFEANKYFDTNPEVVTVIILAILLALLFLAALIGFRRSRQKEVGLRLITDPFDHSDMGKDH